jgi:hypothetical protein
VRLGEVSTLPATAGQAAIWLAEQAAPIGPAYHTCTVLRVQGTHDAESLVTACRQMVRATPGLRARFGLDPRSATIVQWFASHEAPLITLIDAADHDRDAADPIAAEIDRPFEVDEGPLVRFVVTTGAQPGCHEIAIIGHHLVVDGACQLALARRLGGCVAGGCPVQPESAYTTLVDEVRRREERARSTDAPYWRQHLPRHYPVWPPAPPEPARAPVGRVSIEASIMAAVLRVAEAAGGRVSQLLAAAVYKVLAGRGVPVPVICLAASVRPRDGSCDGVVGGFVTQVPLVMPDDPPVASADLVRVAGEVWREALRRRYFPFPELSAMARRVAGTSDARLDRVMVTYRRVPARERWCREGTWFEVEPHRPYRSAKTDISFRLLHHPEHLDCQVELGGAAASRFSATALAEELRALLRREVGG